MGGGGAGVYTGTANAVLLFTLPITSLHFVHKFSLLKLFYYKINTLYHVTTMERQSLIVPLCVLYNTTVQTLSK